MPRKSSPRSSRGASAGRSPSGYKKKSTTTTAQRKKNFARNQAESTLARKKSAGRRSISSASSHIARAIKGRAGEPTKSTSRRGGVNESIKQITKNAPVKKARPGPAATRTALNKMALARKSGGGTMTPRTALNTRSRKKS